jgi:hypothetical protein
MEGKWSGGNIGGKLNSGWDDGGGEGRGNGNIGGKGENGRYGGRGEGRGNGNIGGKGKNGRDGGGGDGGFGGRKKSLPPVPSSLEFWMLGFWLHRSGRFWGLKVKSPAENMWVPCFLDLRWSEDEVAVEATAQFGSLLPINFTEHPSIVLTCSLTEKGRRTLNSPWSSVFTSFRKLGFEDVAPLHSTATDAPAYDFRERF